MYEGPEAKAGPGDSGAVNRSSRDRGVGLGLWQGSQGSFCTAHKGSHQGFPAELHD